MDKLTIVTNNKPRPIIYGYDLRAKERKEFSYYKNENELNSATFFRYRGHVYDLHEIERLDNYTTLKLEHPEVCLWHGISSDSYFSGILIRYSADYEQVIVARYYC